MGVFAYRTKKVYSKNENGDREENKRFGAFAAFIPTNSASQKVLDNMGKILMRHKFGHKIFCASQEVHLVEHGQKQLKIPKYTFLVQYAKIPILYSFSYLVVNVAITEGFWFTDGRHAGGAATCGWAGWVYRWELERVCFNSITLIAAASDDRNRLISQLEKEDLVRLVTRRIRSSD
jgi:hypothetical protein